MLRSFFGLFLASSLQLFAQTGRVSLTGTVTDSTGARVPNATVTALQNATGQERKVDSSSQGTYILDSLPLGKYTITVTKAGFSDYRVMDVQQTIGETRTL